MVETATVEAVYAREGELPNLESRFSGITWSAILGGAVAALAVSVILFAVGSGLGFASVSPWSGEGATAAAIGVGAAVWLVVVQWVSSAAGGYLAARVRTKWAAHNTDEVFFRDTVHGFLAWGVATLFVAIISIHAATGLAGLGASAASAAASAPVSAAALDRLFRPAAPETTAPSGVDTVSPPSVGLRRSGGETSEPSASAAYDVRAESGRILATGISGDLDAADRTYLAQRIAAETGATEAEATERVDNAVAQAKEAADTARTAAATAALLTSLSLIVGAFIAAVAGAIGGWHRDAI